MMMGKGEVGGRRFAQIPGFSPGTWRGQVMTRSFGHENCFKS